MKGIILAGGSATRLYPITLAVSKQMLPVYDKPMIYYPLSTLMMAGIREVLIISTPVHLPAFKNLLGDGSRFGMKLEYKVQEKPVGLADAFILGEDFIGNDNVSLILGDNMIYGSRVERVLKAASNLKEGGIIFGYQVADPTSYGVVEIDKTGKALSIEEKPENPKSNTVVFAMYLYQKDTIPLFEKYLSQGNNPDAPGNFPAWLYKQKEVYAYTFKGECYDIGTPESYQEVQALFQK